MEKGIKSLAIICFLILIPCIAANAKTVNNDTTIIIHTDKEQENALTKQLEKAGYIITKNSDANIEATYNHKENLSDVVSTGFFLIPYISGGLILITLTLILVRKAVRNRTSYDDGYDTAYNDSDDDCGYINLTQRIGDMQYQNQYSDENYHSNQLYANYLSQCNDQTRMNIIRQQSPRQWY